MEHMRTCRPHPCSDYHRGLVATYRERVALWRADSDGETNGYDTELAHYKESHPCPLFKDHIHLYAKENHDESISD